LLIFNGQAVPSPRQNPKGAKSSAINSAHDQHVEFKVLFVTVTTIEGNVRSQTLFAAVTVFVTCEFLGHIE
jgi:hypothetical protein